MKKSSAIFLVLTLLATSSWAGFFGIDDETKAKMAQNNLTLEEVCDANKEELHYKCKELYIEMEHVDKALRLREEKQKTTSNNLEKFKKLQSKCDEVGGSFSEGSSDHSDDERIAYSKCEWRFSTFRFENLDQFLAKANEYIDKRNAKRSAWAKEAEKYSTVKELCNSDEWSIYSLQYEDEKRDCYFPYESDDFEKFSYIKSLVLPKDKEQALIATAQNPAKWEKEAKSFKGTLDELCSNISFEYINDFAVWWWVPNTLECKTGNKIVDEKYLFMKPLLIKQHEAVMAKREKQVAAQKEKVVVNERQNEAKWKARLGHTNPLKLGSSYKCEPEPKWGGLISSLYGDIKVELSLGRNTAEFGGNVYQAIDELNNHYLYSGNNSTTHKSSSIKVLKSSGVKGGNTNISVDNIGYYCE